MNRRLRSLPFGSTFALAAILVARAGPEARAQIFGYAIEDAGSAGALGSAVARIGDYDADGCEDFVVGEPNFTVSGVSGTGRVRVESGRTGSEITTIDTVMLGENFGAALDGRIDLDGDGVFDVLIGAPLNSTFAPLGGAVYGYSIVGQAYLDVDQSAGQNNLLGSSVRSLGADVDFDGSDDFVAGLPGVDAIYVISGKKDTLLQINSGQIGSGFGTAVSRGGDLDSDGTADFVVGSPDFVDSGGTKTGRVTAISGKSGIKLWSVDGAADSKFGESLALPGDLDGDGQSDIVVGAPRHLDSGGNKTGCATVLSGANHSVLYKVFGDNANDTFGHDVHAVGGDVDNDGTNDFIVGAPQLLGSDVGYARTISGANGKTLFTYTEHTSDPNQKSNYGKSVAGGDFDGDGRTDVLIGGSNFNSGDGIAETWITAVANWNNYGAGWPGTNGVPGFTALAPPVVGSTLTLDLDNSAGVRTAGELLVGFSKASIPTGKGGTILVDMPSWLTILIPAGGLTITDQVPDNPFLYGFHMYLQAIEVDFGASKKLSFTQGLDLEFGF